MDLHSHRTLFLYYGAILENIGLPGFEILVASGILHISIFQIAPKKIGLPKYLKMIENVYTMIHIH